MCRYSVFSNEEDIGANEGSIITIAQIRSFTISISLLYHRNKIVKHLLFSIVNASAIETAELSRLSSGQAEIFPRINQKNNLLLSD